MKLAYIGFEFEIDFDKYNIINLVIENVTLYRQMINDLLINTNIDGNFLIYDNVKLLQFDLNIFVFYDYFTIDINKKVLNKYYKKLCLISETELAHEFYELKTKISEFIFNLLDVDSLNTSYDDIDIINLFKSINLKFNNDGTILENLLYNIKVINSVLGIEIFILTNIQLYFNMKEIIEIFKFVRYNKFKVIILGNVNIQSDDIDKTITIDSDLCEIF